MLTDVVLLLLAASFFVGSAGLIIALGKLAGEES